MFKRTSSLLLLALVCMGASCRRAAPVAACADTAPPTTLNLPDNLAEAVWTNYIARTNGRTLTLWAKRLHPTGWPTSAAPVLVWNSTALVRAFSNYTAISQCWEDEGCPGQVAVTLLTRRHAYARGHHVGAPTDGQAHLLAGRVGKRVWCVTPDNQVVEARIANWLTRVGSTGSNSGPDNYCDYSLMIFSQDLPASLQPVKALRPSDYRALYTPDPQWPRVILQTEQGGRVSSGIPPFVCDTWRGGDSGSPDLLPVGDWLVFIGGRSATGPTDQMQADLDTLSRSQGLDPGRYRLDWVGLGVRSPGTEVSR